MILRVCNPFGTLRQQIKQMVPIRLARFPTAAVTAWSDAETRRRRKAPNGVAAGTAVAAAAGGRSHSRSPLSRWSKLADRAAHGPRPQTTGATCAGPEAARFSPQSG